MTINRCCYAHMSLYSHKSLLILVLAPSPDYRGQFQFCHNNDLIGTIPRPLRLVSFSFENLNMVLWLKGPESCIIKIKVKVKCYWVFRASCLKIYERIYPVLSVPSLVWGHSKGPPLSTVVSKVSHMLFRYHWMVHFPVSLGSSLFLFSRVSTVMF